MLHQTIAQINGFIVDLNSDRLNLIAAAAEDLSDDCNKILQRILGIEADSSLETAMAAQRELGRESYDNFKRRLRLLCVQVRSSLMRAIKREQILNRTRERNVDYSSGPHGTSRFFRRFRSRLPFSSLTHIDADGNDLTASDPDSICSALADSLEAKFNREEAPAQAEYGANSLTGASTDQEWSQAIQLPINKAYPDFWNGIFTACLPPCLTSILREGIDSVLEGQTDFPGAWKRGSIVPVPKRTNNLTVTSPDNIRPIGLLPGPFRIIDRIIAARLKPLVEALPINQAAFRPRSSCLNQFTELQHKIRSTNKILPVVVQLDVKGAFDRLLREEAFSFIGLDRVSTTLLSNLSHLSFVVSKDGHHSREFLMSRGVIQGGSQSPLLFILAFQTILNALSNAGASPCGFADDVTFVCGQDEVPGLLNVVQAALRDLGLELNARKTKIVKVGRGNYGDIAWNNHQLQLLDHSTVLGFNLGNKPSTTQWIRSKALMRTFGLLSSRQRASINNLIDVSRLAYPFTGANPSPTDTRKINRDSIRSLREFLMLKDGCTEAISLLSGHTLPSSRAISRQLKLCLEIINGTTICSEDTRTHLRNLLNNRHAYRPSYTSVGAASLKWLIEHDLYISDAYTYGNVVEAGPAPIPVHFPWDHGRNIDECTGSRTWTDIVAPLGDGLLRAYTDGSANHGRFGFGVFYETEDGQTRLYGSRISDDLVANPTNNTCELTAAVAAIRGAGMKDLELRTDSKYVINVLDPSHKWAPTGPNAALIWVGQKLLEHRARNGAVTSVLHVKAHNEAQGDMHSLGNGIADRAALAGSQSTATFSILPLPRVGALELHENSCYVVKKGDAWINSSTKQCVYQFDCQKKLERWVSLREDRSPFRARQTHFPLRFLNQSALLRATTALRHAYYGIGQGRWARFPLSWTLSMIGGFGGNATHDWEEYALRRITQLERQGGWRRESCTHGNHLLANKTSLIVNGWDEEETLSPRRGCHGCDLMRTLAHDNNWISGTQNLLPLPVQGANPRLDLARVIELTGALSDDPIRRKRSGDLLYTFLLHIHQFWLDFRSERWPDLNRQFAMDDAPDWRSLI